MRKFDLRPFGLDAEEAPAETRGCAAPGCMHAGVYRAPKSRDRLTEYVWFCLDHVRAYNKAWDYYAGMSEAEIEANLRRDVTWQRPTWPMGFWRTRDRSLRDEVLRNFGFSTRSERASGGPQNGARRPRTVEEKALAVLELDPPVDFARIKARYRELVKRHHPDANGGDRAAEETLKHINQAYTTLKASYGS